jgi:two-component system response regulator PhcR
MHDVTLLYVDDEALTRKYFAQDFSRYYNVLLAESADAAIALLKEGHKVDMLLTDYRMPGRDGGDLLREIQDLYPSIVRMLVTAYADKEMLISAINTGDIFRILEKPYDMVQVRRELALAAELARERRSRLHRLMAVDETLAFLAHELNTPLASILGFSSGIQRRMKEPLDAPRQNEVERASERINEAAAYCMSVLSSFLASVRNVNASASTRLLTSARELVTALLDTYPLTPAQRASIAVEVSEDFVITDAPVCATLVLSSLLSNALRALEGHESPHVAFAIEGGDRPQIRIADNGPGVPQDVLNELFVAPVTTYKDAGGNGMGMIFCNRIMQSFFGGIDVQSTPGQGTSITLYFPKRKANPGASDE